MIFFTKITMFVLVTCSVVTIQHSPKNTLYNVAVLACEVALMFNYSIIFLLLFITMFEWLTLPVRVIKKLLFSLTLYSAKYY